MIQFQWTRASDPDGDTLSYDIYLCEDAGFTVGCITDINIASLFQGTIHYAAMGIDGKSLLLLLSVPLLICSVIKRKRTLLPTVILVAFILLISCGDIRKDFPGEGAYNTGASGDVNHSVSGLSACTTYYWKVVAKDGHEGEATSTVWTFDTL